MYNHRIRFILIILLLLGGAHEAVAQHASGRTFGNEVKLETLPLLRSVSKDSVDGRPTYDYFVLVKAKLNGVFDIDGGLQAEETFNVARIDVYGTDDTNRFWMDMHQSQVRFRGQRETGDGTFIGDLEGDFWSGSKRFRLRHLWVDYKFIHFGQDWTFFGDKEVWPNVMDCDGPPWVSGGGSPSSSSTSPPRASGSSILESHSRDRKSHLAPTSTAR